MMGLSKERTSKFEKFGISRDEGRLGFGQRTWREHLPKQVGALG